METNEKATTLEELVNSEEYKKSDYDLIQIDGKYYGLRMKDYHKFLDLKSSKTHHWDIRVQYKDDCITKSKDLIVERFYRKHPIVKEISEVKFTTKPIKSELEQYKSKLMEGLE